MRVTIIKEDNSVTVDGVGFTVDCSDLPAGFHALQWDGTYGEVEYVAHMRANDLGRWHKKPNETVTNFAPYQPYVVRWNEAKAAAEAAIAAEKAKADAARQ